MEKKKIIIVMGISFLLLGTLGFIFNNKTVEASRYLVKDGNLLQVNESLNSGKQITNNNNVQILFDEKSSKLLIGQGVKKSLEDSENQEQSTELYLINNDGSDSKKITEDSVSEAFLNNSGTKIYFVTKTKDLYEFDVVSGQKTLLKEKVFEATISYDESKIAYHKLNTDWQVGDYYEKALGIAVLDLKTNIETQATNGPDHFFPIWTPDNSKIIFYAANEGGLVSQFVVDVDGKNKKQTTNIGQIYYSDKTVDHATGKPKWSPDGKVLVYESDNKIWTNDFTLGTDKVKTKKIGFGKEPQWIDNSTLSLIATDATNVKNSIIKVDKDGNIIK